MPLATITKYSPQADVVAGRTASQIQAAKRKAVGGKRKKCIKGKSCSATCIAANKVCMVDIPWVVAQGIPKVVAQIKKVQSERKIKKPDAETQELAKSIYNVEWKQAWKKMNLAISEGNKQSYQFHKNQITKYYEKLKAKGIELGELKVPAWKDKESVRIKPEKKPQIKPTLLKESGEGPVPKPGERWKPAPGFVTAGGPKPELPPMKTGDDFGNVYKDTNYLTTNPGPARDAFKLIEDLMWDARSSNPSKATKDILDAVGGIENFEKGIAGIKRFTGSYYKEIRESQKALSRGEELSAYRQDFLNSAINAEKLLPYLPKESLIKFRGVSTSDERLLQTIAASKAKLTYQDGALASWSVRLSTAESFSYGGGTGYNAVIYRTINKRGAAINNISQHIGEGEVLTPASAQYRHTGSYEKVEHNGRTYHIFDVEEL